jgi:hypothetical protein
MGSGTGRAGFPVARPVVEGLVVVVVVEPLAVVVVLTVVVEVERCLTPAQFRTMHETEIEAACDELGLDEAKSEFVRASHRFGQGYLRTILDQGGDYRTYVKASSSCWPGSGASPS